MPLAILIHAHRNPAQVARLFSVLWHREDTFVLHCDRRAPAELHALGSRLAATYPNVHQLKPRPVVRGGPALAEIQVEAMAVALARGTRWTHFLNLTGQDFPLKSRREMLDRLERGRTYLGWFDPLDNVQWPDAQERLARFHLAAPWLQRVLALPGVARLLRPGPGGWNRRPCIPVLPRRWPDFFHYYGGANQVALARDAAVYLVEDPAARRIRRWLRYAAHSDEIVFQSVLLNSPLAGTVVNETLREIDFPAHSPHPRTFTTADLPRLLGSNALFARKFDPVADPRVLDVLASRLSPALNA